MTEWMRLFEDDDYCTVAYYSNYEGDFEVSTVWIGIPNGYGPSGPLIFETKVFQDGEDTETYRYATLAEALRSHDRLCGVTDDERDNPSRMSMVLEEDD